MKGVALAALFLPFANCEVCFLAVVRNGDGGSQAVVNRNKEAIIKWVNTHSVTNSELIEDCEKMKSVARGEEAMIAAYFGPLSGPQY